MKRALEPELLDELPPHEARAIQSRKDLRRINWWMGNAGRLWKFACKIFAASPSREVRIAEIGAGDGTVGFQLAARLSNLGIGGKLFLIDRYPVVEETMIKGWSCQVIAADIFQWLSAAEKVDLMIANLFLHHFEDIALRELLASAARITDCFIACEPRRGSIAQFIARNVWVIGCNAVTCHDAGISVRAGFQGRELSHLWPIGPWSLAEGRAGMFSHFFSATRPR